MSDWYTSWTGSPAVEESKSGPDRRGVMALATSPPPDVFLRAGADAKTAADAYEKAYLAHVASCGPSVSNEECMRGATAAGTVAADAAVTNKRLAAAAATKPAPKPATKPAAPAAKPASCKPGADGKLPSGCPAPKPAAAAKPPAEQQARKLKL